MRFSLQQMLAALALAVGLTAHTALAQHGSAPQPPAGDLNGTRPPRDRVR